MSIDSVARLKITLDHVRPQVLRRIEVPADLRLDRLHSVIQAAMGWEDCHLWEFDWGGVRFGPHFEDDYDRPLNAAKTTLQRALADIGAMTLTYLYDFGDGWTHTIKIERLCEADPNLSYPRLLQAERACPPEDVGGPFGYEEYLEALGDPKHERHEELVEWRGPHFDANDAQIERIEETFGELARHWTRRRAPRKRKAA